MNVWVDVELRWNGEEIEMITNYSGNTETDGPYDFKSKRLFLHDSAWNINLHACSKPLTFSTSKQVAYILLDELVDCYLNMLSYILWCIEKYSSDKMRYKLFQISANNAMIR